MEADHFNQFVSSHFDVFHVPVAKSFKGSNWRKRVSFFISRFYRESLSRESVYNFRQDRENKASVYQESCWVSS